MDQLKVFLNQAIKHRFWIAVGVACLLPIIAYVVGSGPVKTKAEEETKAIKGAHTDVQQYAAAQINGQYKPVVLEKKEELAKDVRNSWKKLYESQAPLLTWPERVKNEFPKWGRKWPEGVDNSTVQLAVNDYIFAYPKYVDQVYESFRPFDPISGKGVVRSPSAKELLRPSEFSEQSPPSVGKVWAAQEKLWLQRTMLDVIATVNEKASGWDTAIIKQISELVVGTPEAQDQRSMAKGETLEEEADIVTPGTEVAKTAPATGSSSSGSGGSGSSMDMMKGGYGSPQEKDEGVIYKLKSDSAQYRIMPVSMTVLIDQDHIPDLLCAMENSPMAIQVKDFDMAKPSARVTKPVKGENMFAGMGMMGGYGRPGGMMMPMMSMGGPRMRGFGGMAAMMPPMGMMSGPTARAAERKGVSLRQQDLEKKRKEEISKAGATHAHTIHDPYYNIVEVTVIGQVRLYKEPPEEPAAQASQAGTPPAEPKKEEATTKETEPAKGEPATKKDEESAKAEEKAKGSEAESKKDEGEGKKDKPESKKDEGETKKDESASKKEEPASKKDEAAKDESGGKKAEAGSSDAESKGKGQEPKGPDEKKDAAPKKDADSPKADAAKKKGS